MPILNTCSKLTFLLWQPPNPTHPEAMGGNGGILHLCPPSWVHARLSYPPPAFHDPVNKAEE